MADLLLKTIAERNAFSHQKNSGDSDRKDDESNSILTRLIGVPTKIPANLNFKYLLSEKFI